MNGEVKTYRLNSPMTWKEFKQMPDEHQINYIKLIRQKWNASDSYISKMFDVTPHTLMNELKRLGINRGKSCGHTRTWDKDGFLAWAMLADTKEETETTEALDPTALEVVEDIVSATTKAIDERDEEIRKLKAQIEEEKQKQIPRQLFNEILLALEDKSTTAKKAIIACLSGTPQDIEFTNELERLKQEYKNHKEAERLIAELNKYEPT